MESLFYTLERRTRECGVVIRVSFARDLGPTGAATKLNLCNACSFLHFAKQEDVSLRFSNLLRYYWG